MSTSTDNSQFESSSSEGSIPAPPFDMSFYVIGQPVVPVLGVPVLGRPFEQLVRDFEHRSHSDIDDLMPKLQNSYYYTEPTIQKLAAKERAEPGYCCRVKDFVMGRPGVGSVRFLGETDVRRVDLEYFIRFVDRTFTYSTRKPPGGQGYNETAEITIVGEKCSREEMSQVRMIRYVECYKKTIEAKGMEYVSHDPITGEFKFRVKYFSGLGMILFKIRKVG